MNEIAHQNGMDRIVHDVKDHEDIILHFDGGVRPKNPGEYCCFGYMALGKNGLLLVKGFRWLKVQRATNNYSEYCGAGFGLKFLIDHEWAGRSLSIRGDSQLICNQLAHEWKIKDDRLRTLAERCWEHLETLGLDQYTEVNETMTVVPQDVPENTWHTLWLPRERNCSADRLTFDAWKHCQDQLQLS